MFASGTSKRQPRKSSILRASDRRRLSDTQMLYVAAESLKRLSIAGNSELASKIYNKTLEGWGHGQIRVGL